MSGAGRWSRTFRMISGFQRRRIADHKDPNRVAGGFKAAINNPNVSGPAKAHAQEELERMGQPGFDAGQDPNRVLGGYKATLSVSFQVIRRNGELTNEFHIRTSTHHRRPKLMPVRYWKLMDIPLSDLIMCRKTNTRRESWLDTRLH
ncbi:hypothetical protein EIP86_001222 [Pleurotus ostreatoroseus]|nr:hypothetical protein EIP86_001222 [Pleurotus ostreatoroseus]